MASVGAGADHGTMFNRRTCVFFSEWCKQYNEGSHFSSLLMLSCVMLSCVVLSCRLLKHGFALRILVRLDVRFHKCCATSHVVSDVG